ncbi:MAG: CDGSH iron-sulfur domain-containing protein [Bacteroidetes bacterium]|nr:CDGSH iron-sulfur domain-containing protein [Bacteroidota bacterium]
MSTKITIRSNGSIRLEGDFELYDQDGNRFELNGRTAVSLCRCGHTATPPFCDGAHKEQFDSPIQAYELPAPR